MEKEAVGMEQRAVVTEEMMAAGARSLIDGQANRPGSSWADEALWCYEAMHALAQQPAAQAAGLTEAAAALLDAVEQELSPEWDCASYHPSLRPAAARLRALLSRVAPSAQQAEQPRYTWSQDGKTVTMLNREGIANYAEQPDEEAQDVRHIARLNNGSTTWLEFAKEKWDRLDSTWERRIAAPAAEIIGYTTPTVLNELRAKRGGQNGGVTANIAHTRGHHWQVPIYTAPAAAEGEEIHVHIEGHDVYTATLHPSGMASPRFVVHVRAAAAEAQPDRVEWDKFPAWLIDHHEGDTISEELLQRALADMLKAHPPAADEAANSRQAQGGALGLTDKQRTAIEHAIGLAGAARMHGTADVLQSILPRAASEARADCQERADAFVREFQEWVKQTGALPWGGSWMAEVSSIIERAALAAQKKGA